MRSLLLPLLFLFANAPGALSAQEKLPAPLVFPQFVRAIDRLDTTQPDAADLLRSARRDFEQLANLLSQMETPPQYEKAFADYARELEAIASSSGSVRVERISDLTEDIRIKREFVRSGFALDFRRNKYFVLLQVTTRDPTRNVPVHGFRVTLNPSYRADRDPPQEVWGKLTSPTEGLLMPGRYVVRILRDVDGAVVRTIRNFSVGLEGKDKEELEVAIGSGTPK